MSADVFRPGVEPLVLAYHLRSSPVHLGFWCPWCRCVHLHGAGGGDGNRVAHCKEKVSPLFGRGVDLLFAGTVGSGLLLPQMSSQEMTAFSNYISGVGGNYFQWRPLMDAAGNAIARRRVGGRR